MRLIKYINEYATELNMDKLLSLLHSKCKNNGEYVIKNGPPLFRGDNILYDDFYVFNGQSARNSAHTSNHYTLLFSEILSSGKNMPKRNKSVICTTNYATAESYGNIYCVIPFDNAKLAITSRNDDIWDTLKNVDAFKKMSAGSKLTHINYMLKALKIPDTLDSMKHLCADNVYNIIQQYKQNPYTFDGALHFVYGCTYILPELKKYKNKLHAADFLKINNIIEENKDILYKTTIYSIFNTLLTPENLRIETVAYNKLNTFSDNEVGTDSPAILVDYNHINILIKKDM